MLEKLLRCKTIAEFNDLGESLLCSSIYNLLYELQEKQYIFSMYDFWSDDLLSNYISSDLNFKRAIKSCNSESEDKQVLHRLQLFGKCCPAMSDFVSTVLERAMY